MRPEPSCTLQLIPLRSNRSLDHDIVVLETEVRLFTIRFNRTQNYLSIRNYYREKCASAYLSKAGPTVWFCDWGPQKKLLGNWLPSKGGFTRELEVSGEKYLWRKVGGVFQLARKDDPKPFATFNPRLWKVSPLKIDWPFYDNRPLVYQCVVCATLFLLGLPIRETPFPFYIPGTPVPAHTS